MRTRFGLRPRMAVSYVLVSAAAVLVVEAVLLAVAVPRIRAADDRLAQARQRERAAEVAGLEVKVDALAVETASRVSQRATAAARDARAAGGAVDAELLTAAAGKEFGPARDGGDPRREPVTAEVAATVDGRVVASSRAEEFPPGSRLPAEATAGPDPSAAARGATQVGGAPARWATRPVTLTAPGGQARTIGLVYTRLAIVPEKDGAKAAPDGGGLGSLLLPGAVVLVLLVPVGALFGLLSTGRLIRRVHRLADGASALAGGDLTARIPVSGGDEVGRLELAFTTMAERLEAAVRLERRVAGGDARRAERSRIARELHDSISQDLFSASLLAGGLRKALPPGDLRHQAGSMEQTLARTMREMRAMLLELRPVALADAGLAEALGRLCRAYGERLGIRITAAVDPVGLDPAVEHAVLRVAQEALGNAVRHGEPGAVELRVAEVDGKVAVTVHDDGRGFDPAEPADGGRMGLELMRERVGELGGTVQVRSAPGQGTTLTVLLPGGAP